MAKTLTPKEILRYGICNKAIKDGMATVFDVGERLREVRDTKLYRDDYETFDDYCEQKHQIGKSHSYRLIEAAEVKASINKSPIGDKITNEAQARALADVPEEQRVEVVREAAKSGEVTAASIEAAAEKVVEPEKPKEKEKDKTGCVIPREALVFWKRKDEIQKLMTAVSKVKSAVENGRKEDDVMFRQVYQAAIDSLSRAYGFISDALPYAVCLDCEGRPSLNGGCRSCKGTGLICKMRYDHIEAKEKRIIREKKIESQRLPA